MAKGQQRGNREAKKPKKEVPKVSAAASSAWNPNEKTDSKQSLGKKK